MSSNTVNVKINVTDSGGTSKLTDAALKLKGSWDGVEASVSRASKAITSSSIPSKATASAPKSATAAVTPEEYGRTRGAVGTGAAGRDFAKQSQGLGGLVGLYATFAANIFAVGAAYEALNKAAAAERLSKATEMMSIQVGTNLKGISNNLIEASGHALSFQDAMQFTNIGTSAGLAGKQIESLTKIARGAASALGRDVNDSVRRIIQGTAKQEQEILDELGIFVKSKQAFDKYAQQIGVKADDLTGRQRTQAYADEVERLGEKWKEFAEIDDPFSRFAATGKNALNELLTGVNNFIKPVLSFLSESKSGIQAIIALVTVSLTKRALPELGNLFNNVFNYDKQIAASKSQEILTDVRATRQALAKELLATKVEIDNIAKSTVLSKASITSLTGGLAGTKGSKKAPGVAGISVDRLSSSILGSEEHPKNLALLKNKEVVETRILSVLNAQVASKAASVEIQEAYVKSLVTQGVVEEGSLAKNLVLSNKSKVLASEIYNISSAQIGNEAKKVALAETMVALKTEEAYQAEREIKAEQSTAKGSSTIPRKNVEAFKVVGTTAIVATETAATIATEAHTAAATKEAIALSKGTIAAEIKAVATANLTLSAKLAAEGAQNITNAYGAGFSISGLWNGLKQTGIEMKTQYLQMKANIVGLGQLGAAEGVAAKGQWMLSASWLAGSAAAKTLGLAIKGIMGALNMLLMPLMVVMTVWSLFGDKIGSLLPESVQAAVGIGKVAEAAKAAEEKQKSYNESLEISAKNLAMLADMKSSGKVENLAEEADIEERIAKSLKERLSLLTETAEKVKAESEANKRRAEEIRIYGKSFSEAALSAKELSRILELADHPELAKQAKDIANEYQYLQSKLERGIVNQKQYAEQLDIIKDKELALATLSSKVTEQKTTDYTKQVNAIKSLGDELDKAGTRALKAYDPIMKLGEHGKIVYKDLDIVFQGNAISAYTYLDSLVPLRNAIERGGKTAAAAIPIYALLQSVLNDPDMKKKDRGGNLVLDLDKVNEKIKELQPILAKLNLGLSSTLDKPTGGKVKEYTTDAKKGFREIEQRIESAKLEQIKLDKEFANTSAIQKRNDAVLGYQSAESNALEKSNALRKNEADLVNTITSAYSTLRKTLDSKTRSPEEKLGAVASYDKDVNTAVATKDAANQSAELTYQANTTATAISALTKAYELLNLQQANEASIRNNAFELNELDISNRNSLLNLSERELAQEAYSASVRKAKNEQTESAIKAEDEYDKAINKLMLSGANESYILEEVTRLLALKGEGLSALALKYNFTEEQAKKFLATQNQAIADKGDWTKGAVKGLQDYEKSAMDVAGNTQQAFGKAFKGMEDALTDFVMTGKLDFASLANSIISDMIRIMIQQSITGPLASMAMSFFAADGAAFSSGGVKAMAKGGAYELGAQAFAKGGTFTNSIVSSPTLFKFANGTGLMGEAGPEAIMPLKRDANGTLGVRTNALQQQGNNVTINIIESPEKAGTQERTTNNGTDMITIFVEKVKSAIASDISRGSGVVPNALSRTYGLNRSAGAY